MATMRERGYSGAWPRVRLAILRRDRWRCRWCGGRANQVDHVIPISAGGARLDPRNLVASCLRCNVRRAREREEREGFPNRPSWSVSGRGTRRVWNGAITLVACVVGVIGTRCGGGDGGVAPPAAPAKYLAQPFTGAAVPKRWAGKWHNAAADIDWHTLDIDWHILAATSPECRSLTRSRTTCFTFGPAGSSTQASDVLAAGAITVKDRMVIFRMTYSAGPSLPGCFEDDAYRYRYTAGRLEVLKDDQKHCFWERGEGDGRRFAILERPANGLVASIRG